MSNYLFYFIECHLFNIGPFKFNISKCKVHQWCKDFRLLDPHVMIVVDHSKASSQLLFIFRWHNVLQGFNLFGKGLDTILGNPIP